MRKYGFHDWNSCLATVGHGGLKEGQIVNRMYEEYKKDHLARITDEEVLETISENKEKVPEKKSRVSCILVRDMVSFYTGKHFRVGKHFVTFAALA